MGLSNKCCELVKNHKIATSGCPKFTPWTKVAFFQWKLMIILRRRTRLQNHEFILSCAAFTHFFLIYTQSCVIKTQKNYPNSVLQYFCLFAWFDSDTCTVCGAWDGIQGFNCSDLQGKRNLLSPHSSYPKYLRVELGNNFDYKAGVFWLLEKTVNGMKQIADRESVRGNTDPCVQAL